MFPWRALVLSLLFAGPAAGQIGLSIGDTDAMSGRMSVAKDRVTFTLGFPGSTAETISIEARTGDVVEVDGGLRATGDLTLRTGLGRLPLLKADLFFARNAQGTIHRLRGRCAVPAPFASKRVRVASPAMAEVGLDLGQRIDLGVPLRSGRMYLFFHFDTGFAVEIATGDDPDAHAPIKLSVPPGADGTLILDPLDSFYYLGGAFLPKGDKKKGDDKEADKTKDGKKGDKKTNDEGTGRGGHKDPGGAKSDRKGPKDADGAPDVVGGKSEEKAEGGSRTTGEGRSQQGLIPFAPESVRGIEKHVRGFLGHRVQTGSIPLGQLPLVVDGYLVTRFDTDAKDGFDPFAIGIAPAYRAGANGEILVTFPLAKVAGLGTLAEFGFSLGKATAGLEVSGERQLAYFTGHIDPDLSWLPKNATPFTPQRDALVAGLLSSNLADSYLRCRGRVGIDVSYYARLAGLEVSESLSLESSLEADKNGILVRSRTGSPVGPFVPSGEVELEARFARPEKTYLSLAGAFSYLDQRLDGKVVFAPKGASIAGSFRGDVELDVSGRLERRDKDMRFVAAIVPSTVFQDALHKEVLGAAKKRRQQIDKALAELQAATRDYEFELSLRGTRKVIPVICDRAIKEIDSIPATIRRQWPKKKAFGKTVELPGRAKATEKAQKDARPTRNRLRRLKDAARRSSDERFRAELKSAIEDLVRHRRLRIKVARIGTVYDKDVISRSQKAQLEKAIVAVDAMPAASKRKIAASKVYETIPAKSILDTFQEGTEKQLKEKLPAIVRIRAVLPLRSEAGNACAASALIKMNQSFREVEVKFLPASFSALPGAVARAFVTSL